jgi:hypothetical protein
MPLTEKMPLTPTKYADGNPKTPFGVKKPPTWQVPTVPQYLTGLALLHGRLKYGLQNWRVDPVSASTYINAAQRHIDSWKEGTEVAEDSGIHHLAHAAACLFIVMDAQRYGTMIDDRHATTVDLDALFREMEPIVKRLYEDWGAVKPSETLRSDPKEVET